MWEINYKGKILLLKLKNDDLKLKYFLEKESKILKKVFK